MKIIEVIFPLTKSYLCRLRFVGRPEPFRPIVMFYLKFEVRVSLKKKKKKIKMGGKEKETQGGCVLHAIEMQIS